jgi:hypothetical protein
VSKIEFERSNSGLYLPKQLQNPQKPKAEWLGDAVNALLVVIQAATVWVLWLTYTNTVIPSRQKELLAEQVAQLQIEKGKVLKQIAVSQSRLVALTEQASRQVAEITSLSNDKTRLQSEIKVLSIKEAAANGAALMAQKELSTTKQNLLLAQVHILAEQSASLVAVPALNDSVSQTNKQRGETYDRDIAAVVAAAETQWPNFGPMIEGTVTNLRKLGDFVYPHAIGPTLADVYSEKMKDFMCARPSFSGLKAKYEQEFSAGQSKAEFEATQYEQKTVDDGKKKGIVYAVAPDTHVKDVKSFKISSKFSVLYHLDIDLIQLRSDCLEAYMHHGQAVVDDYEKQQTIAIQKASPSELH